MSISVTIKNDEPQGGAQKLAVTVVTVGQLDTAEEKHLLGAQGSVTLALQSGQFVMVDETDKEGT